MRVVGVASVLLIACSAQAQVAQRGPVCQAELNGEQLITRLHFPDGYTFEGPWHIKSDVKPGSKSISAVLDHIVETRPLSGERQMIELPSTIRMTFTGRTMDDVLDQAASVWCETVTKARPRAPSVEDDIVDEPTPPRFI
jgi:hypothetical protein